MCLSINIPKSMQESKNSFLHDLIDKKETCNKSASVKRHTNHSAYSLNELSNSQRTGDSN